MTAVSEPSRELDLDDAALIRDDGLAEDVNVDVVEDAGRRRSKRRGWSWLPAMTTAGMPAPIELAEEVEDDALGLGGGRDGVEDVAGDEEAVDLLVAGDVERPLRARRRTRRRACGCGVACRCASRRCGGSASVSEW